jgi:hypothetical protein
MAFLHLRYFLDPGLVGDAETSTRGKSRSLMNMDVSL